LQMLGERGFGNTGAPFSMGKMSADQMLAHCNVASEFVFEDKHPKNKKRGNLELYIYKRLPSTPE